MRMFVVGTLSCWALVATQTTVASQSPTKTEAASFSRGTIFEKDGTTHKARELRFGTSLTFIDSESGAQVTTPLRQVDRVTAVTGTRAKEGLIAGGLTLFIASMGALLIAEADPSNYVTNGTEIVLISTAAGLVGGLLIGALVPKNELVFKHNRLLHGERSNHHTGSGRFALASLVMKF